MALMLISVAKCGRYMVLMAKCHNFANKFDKNLALLQNVATRRLCQVCQNVALLAKCGKHVVFVAIFSIYANKE